MQGRGGLPFSGKGKAVQVDGELIAGLVDDDVFRRVLQELHRVAGAGRVHGVLEAAVVGRADPGYGVEFPRGRVGGVGAHRRHVGLGLCVAVVPTQEAITATRALAGQARDRLAVNVGLGRDRVALVIVERHAEDLLELGAGEGGPVAFGLGLVRVRVVDPLAARRDERPARRVLDRRGLVVVARVHDVVAAIPVLHGVALGNVADRLDVAEVTTADGGVPLAVLVDVNAATAVERAALDGDVGVGVHHDGVVVLVLRDVRAALDVQSSRGERGRITGR